MAVKIPTYEPGATTWMADGLCTGSQATSTWFPTGNVDDEYAQGVCAGCRAQARCLEYALAHRIEHGIWGGVTEAGRRAILRARARAAQSSQRVRSRHG